MLGPDVTHEEQVNKVFETYEPQVVFHAAANKHVPILEKHPTEAVRANILGTWYVAQAAAKHGCLGLVHVSTDKAAHPCSVMGATKRVAEQIVFDIGRRYDRAFVAVRFGNVLGSRGSVVPTFLHQILDGGPVTVTSPDMTRYFMTIPEAVSLVLQSGAMASQRKIFLLDMGEPVSILDLARQMIRLAGLRPEHDIPISYIGLRPGERMEERLHDAEPSCQRHRRSGACSRTRRRIPRRCSSSELLATKCGETSAEPPVASLLTALRRSGIACQLQLRAQECDALATPELDLSGRLGGVDAPPCARRRSGPMVRPPSFRRLGGTPSFAVTSIRSPGSAATREGVAPRLGRPTTAETYEWPARR